jgi:hypothetical protein
MTLPAGVVIILGHNIWVWDLPVVVTVAGWMTTLKCSVYLLFPRAHKLVMHAACDPSREKLDRGFRMIGIVMIGLGAVTAYDAFFRR